MSCGILEGDIISYFVVKYVGPNARSVLSAIQVLVVLENFHGTQSWVLHPHSCYIPLSGERGRELSDGPRCGCRL